MRRLLPVALVALAVTGCGGDPASTPAPSPGAVAEGCGPLDAGALAPLSGHADRVVVTGSVRALRTDHAPLACTAGDGAGHRITIRVRYHPDPLSLARVRCEAGWVYAGTADAHSPACQADRGTGGRTTLFHRAGDYVITVVVDRPDLDWAGDPELADTLATRLGDGL